MYVCMYVFELFREVSAMVKLWTEDELARSVLNRYECSLLFQETFAIGWSEKFLAIDVLTCYNPDGKCYFLFFFTTKKRNIPKGITFDWIRHKLIFKYSKKNISNKYLYLNDTWKRKRIKRIKEIKKEKFCKCLLEHF